jgi:pre-60S factor REI1
MCRKQYVSENGYNNHIQSKKHLELEQIADEEEAAAALADDDDTTMSEPVTNGKSLFDSEPSSLATSRVLDPLVDCLFCTKSSEEMESNLEHMKKAHGFFLPDIEYLNDKEGLLKYLSMKINNEKLCLYCNGRGKEWQSVAAAKAHMIDRGHCKMAYDESEDPEELLKYYDFEVNNDDMDVDSEDKSPQENELVLQSGVKLGHRKFMKYYKRNAARKTLVPESEEAQQQQQEEPETLRRKERRHLAITDGKEQELKKTAEGIKEATLSKEFARNVAFKQNTNLRLRARNQNPI